MKQNDDGTIFLSESGPLNGLTVEETFSVLSNCMSAQKYYRAIDYTNNSDLTERKTIEHERI